MTARFRFWWRLICIVIVLGCAWGATDVTAPHGVRMWLFVSGCAWMYALLGE